MRLTDYEIYIKANITLSYDRSKVYEKCTAPLKGRNAVLSSVITVVATDTSGGIQ